MIEPSPVVALGEPRPANVAGLEAALSALWRSAAESTPSGPAVTRACALTLLVYVENEEAGREVSNLISSVTVQNPCRAIVMTAEPQRTPAGLTAWISAHCHLPTAGQRQVCCEQISVLAQGESVRDLDNVVIPLTVPGLPVVLWWRAERFAPPDHFRNILRVTSRVLVDSARFPEPKIDLANLSAEIQRLSGEVTFSDLNWARMTPWRELVAQCFDAAETRAYLDRLNLIRIEYEQESPRLGAQGAQALLFAGWLASRLKWQPESRHSKGGTGGRSTLFKGPQGRIEVQRAPRTFEGGGKGVCVSITLWAGGTPPATFTLERGSDGRNALTRHQIAGSPAIERAVRLEVLNEVDLLNEELRFAYRDRVYEEALQMVARMSAA